MHPKQKEAEARKQWREDVLEDASMVRAQETDLRFVDRPPVKKDFLMEGHTGMTIAYKIRGRRVIKFATACVHPEDSYSKKIGRAVAAINYVEGKTVSVRLPDSYKANEKSVREFMASVIFNM